MVTYANINNCYNTLCCKTMQCILDHVHLKKTWVRVN